MSSESQIPQAHKPSLGFFLSTLHVDMTVLGRAITLEDPNAWGFAVLPLHARILVITEEIAALTAQGGRKSASVLKLRDVVVGLRCPTPSDQRAELEAAYDVVLDAFDNVTMA